MEIGYQNSKRVLCFGHWEEPKLRHRYFVVSDQPSILPYTRLGKIKLPGHVIVNQVLVIPPNRGQIRNQCDLLVLKLMFKYCNK